MKSKWEKAGAVSVDSGMIWIGDPCYVVSKDAIKPFPSWDKFCAEHTKKEKNGAANFDYTGVAVHSGYGDGIYEVFVKRVDGVVKEAKIVFF